MKIMKISQTRTEPKSKNFISSIFNEIFLICKEDKNFYMVKEKINEVDETIKSLLTKVKKQDHLLEKSKDIKIDVTRKISILNNENSRVRNELLEQLGSIS